MYTHLSVRGCCAFLWCSWLSSYNYISPKVYLYRPPTSSAESVRFRSALVVYSKNWISSPLNVICTRRTCAHAIVGNHDAGVVGTAVTALTSQLMCANTTPTKDGCGESSRVCCSRCGLKYVYPGCHSSEAVNRKDSWVGASVAIKSISTPPPRFSTTYQTRSKIAGRAPCVLVWSNSSPLGIPSGAPG